ncbi:MAG: heme-binding protein, partial [Proteobacteria bacterium]|nr:heme-binding protein [Pseudomonadota bacterium]
SRGLGDVYKRQVLQQDTEGKRKVAFVMPSAKTLQNLPVPNDQRVVLKEIPGRRMAVLKYSGTWSEERYQSKLEELRAILRSKGLKEIGRPILARYNPPWIPWFLRRNEIMIEVE